MEDNEGKQKKELKLYATTGDPTGDEGFASFEPKAKSFQDLQIASKVTISFSVAMVEEVRRTQWQREESLLKAAVNATTR